MELIYHGPHDGVEIDMPGGGYIVAAFGEPVDVPSDLANGLLMQPSNWRINPPRAEKPVKVKEAV